VDSSRHLAAILFTDIVGYTSMMQQNEMQAVAVIKRYNAILEKVLTHHRGDLLNNYGDGSLCSFHSTSEAVKCAIEMQQQFLLDPKVPLRIGLHVGEIFFEDGKVLGDGVNIASRIQSLGQANTILFSHEINDKIKNHPEYKSVSLGLFEFKNVEKPVEVFALANDGLAIPKKEQMEGKLKAGSAIDKHKSKKRLIVASVGILLLIAAGFLYKTLYDSPKFSGKEKSIAVLPFDNMSSDKENEYFSDGITEEITMQLSKIADLKVKARTSSRLYKNSKKSIKQIGEELGVAAILEGSVQKSGNQIRITAQLIDANTQEHIWAEKYDRSMNEIFAIHSEVAQQIAYQLNARLSADEKKRIEKNPTNNIAAYEDYLKGRQVLYEFDFSAENYEKIKGVEKKYLDALKKDSTFALAWAGLAFTYRRLWDYDNYSIYHLRNKAMEAAIMGVTYDPELSETNMILGEILKYVTLNPALSLHILQKAINLNANNTDAYSLLAFALMEIGRFKEAETNLVKAKQLDPQSQLMRGAWYQYYINSRNVEKMEGFKKEFTVPAEDDFEQESKLQVFFLKDQYDSLLLYSKQYSWPTWMGIAYAKLGQAENARKMIDILKGTRSESYRVAWVGIIYAWLNEKEKAMDYMDRAFELRSPFLLEIKVHKLFDPLRNEVRFKELLKRMGME
jgi:adenylate cyclase